VTHQVRFAIGAKAIVESVRGAVAAAVSVWENIYVDMICIPNGLNTAPNVGDMFSETRRHPVSTLLSGGDHDDLSGQHARQCCAASISRAA
jgi:hypothetical protein